ncbi:leucine-rich repeat domain-containing protein [Microscilla marina]|uniref:Leucine Rich Repeat domain protein n=1 Tax=Microscilla marina ATCC 23134 TaxID=313606 RepID=A1ZQY8_MICM2|nr:leucine-rich repeat domain-containing protein [Microscilla marina]EAY27293.1 leucine Rich Repeat domain protein [Microscilla marina ATCC 23134]
MTHWRNFFYSSDGNSEEGNYLLKIKQLLKTRDKVNIDLAFQLLRSIEQPAYITLHRLLKATDLNKTMGLYFEQGAFRFLPFRGNSLSLSGCDVQAFPSELSPVAYLRHLYFSFNPIDALPDSITDLPLLQTLDLTHTRLTTLPTPLSQLQHLKSLFLHGTQIQDISWLVNMPQLRYLSLTRAQSFLLTPEVIRQCPQLKSVYVYDAYSDIPEVVAKLPCVKPYQNFFIYDEEGDQCFLKFDIYKQEFAIQIGYWGNRVISAMEWAIFERWLGMYALNPLPETRVKVWYYYQDNIGGWQILMRLLEAVEKSSQIKILWACDDANVDGWEMMEVLVDDYAISIEPSDF